MDIQKEREAFESVFTSENGWDLTWIMGCYQDGRTFNSFAGWKARAQKVAIPEGFVLMNKESLAFYARSIRMFNSGEHCKEEIEEHVCSIEAMIEAQESL